LERARLNNQNACIAEGTEEDYKGFNHPSRSAAGATANLNFTRSSYSTPAGATHKCKENRSKLPSQLSKYNMIEVESDGNCLPLTIAYHIYSSTTSHAGTRVREEVTEYMMENFDLYGNTLARSVDELRKNASAGKWLGEEFIQAAASLYNTQFTVYGHDEDDPASFTRYTSDNIMTSSDSDLNVIFFKNSHYTPLVLKDRSRGHARYRTQSISSSSGSSQSNAGSSNASTTSTYSPKSDHNRRKNSASKSGSHRYRQNSTSKSEIHRRQNSTSKSGIHHRHLSVSRKSASESSRHHRKASKSQRHRDSGTDSISTRSSMGNRYHSRRHHSSSLSVSKNSHRQHPASKSNQDPPKSQHHHHSETDSISTRSSMGDRHRSRHHHSSVSKSGSHRQRSASKSHQYPPSSIASKAKVKAKAKAQGGIDERVMVEEVLSAQSSLQSSNKHHTPSGTIEDTVYVPNDIAVNIDAAPSADMPQTPSTKGSIIDQIGSQFNRLFMNTPKPESSHAIVSTTSSSRLHPTPGTASHAIVSTKRNSRPIPSPSAYSRQTEKTKVKPQNKDEYSVNTSSVNATRGNRTKKGVRKEKY